MNIKSLTLALAVSVFITGCAVGPDYQRPEQTALIEFRHVDGWKNAAPQLAAGDANAWLVFADGYLNQLVQQLNDNNQSLAAAEAAWRESRALVGGSRSALFPQLDAKVSSSRRGVESGISKTNDASLGLSWQLDVWGKVRRQVEASEANLAASEADWAAMRLSLQSELVQNYVQLRVLDQHIRLYDLTLKAYERSLQLTENRYKAGVANRSDVTQALTQLKSTQAQRLDLDWQRSRYEHAIALLLGLTPAQFRIAANQQIPQVQPVPVGLASRLLERRPDIAAAEAKVIAANAEIGVAKAAYFPDFTLNAAGGYQNNQMAHWLTAPNRFWSLGPSFALTLFDAGARKARLEQSRARYDQTVAQYRQTTLVAIREVEDALAQLQVLERAMQVEQEALTAAQENLRLFNNQYQQGMVDYLSVVNAQTAALSAERSLLSSQSTYLAVTAQLIAALGGDW
ncbi:efflux transporter outer membrane subunit [Pseudomonas sp. F1_0610]|uniref:efflux transporter outer membrane subunit n=1 Tax=Pseudomonas sp. F1_0610 TaxID=3114284 RepID=UPI0039C424C2